MPDKGWHRSFDDPIPLPGGGKLRTLRDAGNFIAKLPKREHDAPAWLAAIRALMLVVEHGGDARFGRHPLDDHPGRPARRVHAGAG
jgi:hypothetical protein